MCPAKDPDADRQIKNYRCIWGGGDIDAPITCVELHQEVVQHGWPNDDVVQDRENETLDAKECNKAEFTACIHYEL